MMMMMKERKVTDTPTTLLSSKLPLPLQSPFFPNSLYSPLSFLFHSTFLSQAREWEQQQKQWSDRGGTLH